MHKRGEMGARKASGDAALLDKEDGAFVPEVTTGVYFAMLVMGVGLLTSWNMVMNA